MAEGGFSDVAYFRHRAHTLCMGLFFRLDEYVEDYPTGTPVLLIQLLKDVAQEIDSVIEQIEDKRELNAICGVLAYLSAEALTHLDGAHTAQAPRGLVQMLEKISEKLHPTTSLLVSPQFEYNYSILEILRRIKKATSNVQSGRPWVDVFKGYPEAINIVCFPTIERDNLLVHAVFGHEFGHPIADEFLRQYQAEPAYNDRYKQVFEDLKRKIEPKLLGDDPAIALETQARLVDQVVQIFRRALQELISDVVAVILFGPSALFAAFDILVPFGLDVLPQESDYYPPTRYRLRLMQRVLESDGQMPLLKALKCRAECSEIAQSLSGFVEYLEELTLIEEDLERLKADTLLSVAYDWAEETLPSAIEYAKSRCGPLAFTHTLIQDEVPEGIYRLLLAVPPSEKGVYPDMSVVNWRSALLSGWIFKIYGTTKQNSSWEERSRLATSAHSLTLKALEDCLLGDEYQAGGFHTR